MDGYENENEDVFLLFMKDVKDPTFIYFLHLKKHFLGVRAIIIGTLLVRFFFLTGI